MTSELNLTGWLTAVSAKAAVLIMLYQREDLAKAIARVTQIRYDLMATVRLELPEGLQHILDVK